MNTTSEHLDQLCINTLRFLSVDAVQNANSGHPGLPLGAAPMAYVVWNEAMHYNPANPSWPDRDRFVLSAGHGSALLYSLLYMTGFGLTLDDLRHFRQWGSHTPGHPERDVARGVEVTTGPLGQGLANAVGMAISEAQLAARYNRPGHDLVNHRTWVLASDGDLMEGVSSEAASLAGHLRLGKLICLYDDNLVTLAAGTPITFTEDRAARFEAFGWSTHRVADGNNLDELRRAIADATARTTQPSLILVRTHLGYGSPEQDSFKAHGSPLGVADVAATKRKLGWPEEPPFLVPDEALQHMHRAIDRGRDCERAWHDRVEAARRADPGLVDAFQAQWSNALADGWNNELPVFEADDKGISTRKAGGKVLNAIARRLPALSGGSADLDPSTYTALQGMGDFNPPTEVADRSAWSYAGRNLHFGVREHAMGAIAGGMAAHGAMLPYTATFLVFSDYMRPPMRLAALSGLQVIYVFTHDSIALGEDGPTHQPIEQLVGLRAVPNLNVIRPADANETAVAWQVAIETRDRPTALVLSRQDLPVFDRRTLGAAEGLRRGAYVLADPDGAGATLILLASGSEVALALQASKALQERGMPARVVSMPSWELFDAQSRDYRDSVLPPSVPARLAIEAASPMGWCRYVGDQGDVLGIDRFGASAPGKTVMREYGFTVDEVVRRAANLLEAGA